VPFLWRPAQELCLTLSRISEQGVMADEAQPRLAVILHCDVVGSTTLVRKDERLAHERIQAAFRDIGSAVERYGGAVKEIRGDALVGEFPRASDAVLAALSGQEGNHKRVAALNDAIAPVVRMGIALGEVVIADSTVTGAGVVLAQRLEQLAEPGGICISGAVREALPDRLGLSFESLGARDVKGFDEPVSAYAVSAPEGTPVPLPRPLTAPRTRGGGLRRRWIAASVGAAVLGTASFAWIAPWQPTLEPASPETMANPLQDKPSVAVLPFTNISDDPAQEYFVDGMTEDLITDLSKLSGLFVIARNSVFTYKGKAVKVQQVAEELGVRYVLEGSVRRGGGKVRINAQLIDARRGTHIWADRYDRDMVDVFALQDEITGTIVSALAIKLSSEDEARRERRKQISPDAYDMLLRGNQHLQQFTAQGMAEARELYAKTIELDARYARAYANIAFTHSLDLLFGWSPNREESIRQGMAAVERALALDDRIPQAHFAMSNMRSAQLRNSEAIAASRRAIEVDPNYADAHAQLAGNLTYGGRPDEALESIATGMRLNPRYSAVYLWIQGRALFLLGRYAQAVAVLEEAVERNTGFDQPRLALAATYATMGRLDDARWEAEEILALRPDFSLLTESREKPFVRDQDRKRYIDGLRRAGLPD
jgi:adenylate cyclase